jgi:hypothetical protein
VILRDPYNLFASRFKQTQVRMKTVPRLPFFIELWKKYAKVFIDNTNGVLTINYNDWFSDYNYRRNIENILDVGMNDASMNTLPIQGSSFGYLSYQGKAKQMKVLERWKDMKDNKYLMDIMNDSEISELSTQLFGKII